MRVGLAAFALLMSGHAAGAACDGREPTGLYAGDAVGGDGTKIEITLNLLCDQGRLAAQFFTSSGDFPGGDVRFAGGRLTLGFDTRAALGTLDLALKDGGLAGSFDLAGDKGAVTLLRKGPALAADAMAPRLDLAPKQWHQDLAAFARELPAHHANAFFSLPRPAFDAEVAALDRRIDTANGDEIFVGLQQIAKSIGDGHTGLVAPNDRRVLPVAVAKFGGEFRIVEAGPGAARALGARIVRIAGMRMADVWPRVMSLTPQGELDQLRRENALTYLARGYALHGLDIAPSRDHAVFTLASDDGQSFDLDIAAVPADADPQLAALAPQALRNRDKDAAFTCSDLGGRTVYCAWRAYQDLAARAKTMFALLDTASPGKLIIDMRDNGGGDNTVGYAEIVKPLAARDINRKGRLYVLIGAETFSAAMNNAAQFQDETAAILVGETIGEKPNSYQEPRQFRLPNSHLVVRASTLWYAFRKSGPNVVAPDKEIVPGWDDVKAGRDPVLDWVLARGTSAP
jgi:hypothetical protein